MSRLNVLAILIVSCGSVLGAEPEFKNERAKKAAKAYKAALDEARETYIKELELAIKESGGAGDLDEATRLAEEKESLELEARIGDSDPLVLTRKELENTRWGSSANPRGWLRFLKGNQTLNHLGTNGVWVVTDKTTAVTQSHNRGNSIYVFRFDSKLKSASVHKFVDAKEQTLYTRK